MPEPSRSVFGGDGFECFGDGKVEGKLSSSLGASKKLFEHTDLLAIAPADPELAGQLAKSACACFVGLEQLATQIIRDGYLLDSGNHYRLWFQKGGSGEGLTRDLYGTGGTATACSRSRKKSLPRLRDLRRLKRNVNSSR